MKELRPPDNGATPTPRNREDFEIALICALPLEADCVQAVFDRFWEDEGRRYGKARGDSTEYTTGVIGGHNVVLAHLSGMGKVSAASAASSLNISFPNIKLAIVTGICGAVPSNGFQEILLGDVIVSQALIQYDFGRQFTYSFKRKDTLEDNLGRQTPAIRSLLAKLQTQHHRSEMQDDISKYLELIYKKLPTTRRLGVDADKLFESSYIHKHRTTTTGPICDVCSRGDDQVCLDAQKMSCEELGCDDQRLVARQRLSASGSSLQTHKPAVHYGNMGSGDTVMKSGEFRDRIARAENIIAFEMEGAGVWDQFPSVVVKGVCDYADCHKNKSWQKHAAATAACYVKAFLNRLTPKDQSTKKDLNSNIVWHVPFDHMDGFVGRADELNSLQTTLLRPGGRRRMAIHGLGGIGKSRIAWEVANYARSHVKQYSVFWIQANSASTFENDYLKIGEKLNVPGIKQTGSDIKSLIRGWLSDEFEGNWLMILDNADDESVWNPQSTQRGESTFLADYIPRSPLGFVLITTRSRQIGVRLAGKEIIELRQLKPTEAASTLNGLLSREIFVPDSELMSKLVEQLSYLPLAIVQAAAYMNMNGISIERYMELLDDTEDRIVELLNEDFDDETRYSYSTNPVASTWLISFDQIQQKRPKAIDFLCYMSCLNEKDIPESLLPDATSPKELLEIIGTLTGYSFVRRQTQSLPYGSLYDIHRLVRLATRAWLKSEGTLREYIERTVKQVDRLFPDPVHKDRQKWRLYMPHAKVLCASACGEDYEELYSLLRIIGRCLCMDGLYDDSVKYLYSVAHWCEGKFGEFGETTLATYNNLGQALLRQMNLVKAEEYLVKAYNGNKSLFGFEHSDTMDSMDSLASTYREQGRWIEAERIGIEVLETSKRLLGTTHPITLLRTSNLASTYMEQGRWTEAEVLEIEGLEVSKRVRGNEDPDTLLTIGNLAVIYQKQGRLVEAERLQLDVLEKRKRILGVEHPDTLTSISNLALVYDGQGRLTEAEDLQLEALEKSKRVLGVEHPDTLTSMANLMISYYKQGQLTNAERLGGEVLEKRKKVLGVEHPNTLTSMSNLAITLHRHRRAEEAFVMMKRCIELSHDRLGPDHLDTKARKEFLDWWLAESPLSEDEKRLYIPNLRVSPDPQVANEQRTQRS